MLGLHIEVRIILKAVFLTIIPVKRINIIKLLKIILKAYLNGTHRIPKEEEGLDLWILLSEIIYKILLEGGQRNT